MFVLRVFIVFSRLELVISNSVSLQVLPDSLRFQFFSKLNNLIDMTDRAEYAAICGYTDD